MRDALNVARPTLFEFAGRGPDPPRYSESNVAADLPVPRWGWNGLE